MSQKNEAKVLVLSLLITLGLIGVGFWWFTRTQSLQQIINSNSSQSSSSQTPASSSNLQGFAQVSNVPSGLFSYGGSTTWAPIRRDIDSLIQTNLPQFKLRYIQHPTKPPGSSIGIQMLLDNQLAFAQSSRALTSEEYQQAQQKGFTLQEIPVAVDGIAVAVHPELNITGLTINQLKEIYTGKITNWSQLGGSDIPIKAYSRQQEKGGTVEIFVNNVLGGESLSSTVEFVPTTTQALRKVADNLGGIYYASAPEVVDQCSIKPLPIGIQSNQLVPPYQEPFVPPEACPAQRNQLNSAAFQSGEYPLTRRLFVIIKQNSQVDQEAGEAYANLLLSNEGQDLIEKTGFVRIR